MSHSLLRLHESLCNTPHLVHPSTFDSVMEYIKLRNEGVIKEPELSLEDKESRKNNRYSFNPDSKVAMLNIEGPLTYRPVTMFGMDCGGTNYQTLKEDFTELAELGAKTVALYVDSGGGEAYQMMPSARYIRKLADENGIKILSFVDGMSASAAYGLTSVSDEIIMAEGSEVGSVGVLVRLLNDSKALEMAGYERTYVYAGKDKVPFSADGSFKESFLAEIQDSVDDLYETFTSFVAEHRGLSKEAVVNTDAKTFKPSEAIKLGLADKVMSVEDFFEYLATTAEQRKEEEESSLFKNKLFGNKATLQTNEVNEDMQLEELQTQYSELQAVVQAKDVELSAALSKMAELTEALEASEAIVAQHLAAQQQAEQAAKEAAIAARKASLEEAIGTEQAAALMASLDGVTDAQFDAVVASLQVASKGEKESNLFKEMGADVTVETNPSLEDALAKVLDQQYKTKK